MKILRNGKLFIALIKICLTNWIFIVQCKGNRLKRYLY